MNDPAILFIARCVLLVCLIAGVAFALIRRRAVRATAATMMFWGLVLLAGATYRGLRHGATSLGDFLLLRANVRDAGDFLFFDVPLLLGYACILGAGLAVPWLVGSSAKDVGEELRTDLSIPMWRRFFASRAVWILAALVVIGWRWLQLALE